MKKLLGILFAALLPVTALAQAPSASDLSYGCGLPQQNCTELIADIGNSTGTLTPAADNTYDVGTTALGYRTGYFDTSIITPLLNATSSQTIQVDADAQRLFVFDASSDTSLTLKFGDSGTTAAQIFSIGGSTSDADDDGTLRLCGAGTCNASTQGSTLALFGNEVASTGGSIYAFTGNAAGADVTFAATDDFIIETVGGTDALVIDTATGLASFSVAGGTIALQEATAGSACMGTVTGNGTTAVTVSTTCAATGARILLARSSAPSGTAQCWTDTIVNATSFNLDCDGAETGTFNWFIIKEAA